MALPLDPAPTRDPMGALSWVRWFNQVYAAVVQTPTLAAAAPASSTAPGASGTLAYDANYLYICVGNGQWKRVSLTSF